MGCSSSRSLSNFVANLQSQKIVPSKQNAVDLALEEAQKQDKFVYKILLLGAGESGKTTVVKQIKMLYKNSIANATNAEAEALETISALRRNVIEVIQTLIEASKTLNIEITNQDIKDKAEFVASLDLNTTLTQELAEDIHSIWMDNDIKKVYARRDEFWNLDATPYYLNEIFRISDPYFEPTDEDVIMTRVRTTGLVVTTVLEKPYTYQLVDVAGQRSERRKWIHCFDDVKAIIFLESLSGYNQVLFEDNVTNRMHESINLFAEVIRNPLFAKTPIFLFLNKKDLFEDMIKTYPLTRCFPEYKGAPNDAREAIAYIEDKYREVMAQFNPNKSLNIQVIAARVRLDMKIAFGVVKEELKRLQSSNN